MKKAVLVSVLVCFGLFVPTAHAYIFWSAYDSGNSKVGRADLDATNVNQELVKGNYFGQGVATDGKYVYWGESGSYPKFAYIGRAGLDGSEPNHAFQYGATYCGIFDIVATESHLAWLKSDCSALEYGWDIDRKTFSSAPGEYTEVGAGNSTLCGFDVDANYVYWSEKGRYIVRAPLPGPTLPEREWLDLGAGANPCALAVSGGFIYYTRTAGEPTYRGSSIGRASIDGSEASVNNNFITGTSFTNQSGIDVAGDFIYWVNAAGIGELQGYVGRASTDGTGVAQFFIGPVFNPNSIDVDAGGAQPAPPGSKGTGIPPPPPGPMRIVGVSSSNSSWTPGSGGTAVRLMAHASKKAPEGTVFSYRLNQDAAVTIEVKKVKAGRLVGKKCKKPTKSNKKKKKCDLLAHKLFRAGKSGDNEVPYSGRVKGRALTVGRHVATFTATGAGGKSNTATVSFKIVKP